ncbi:MAG: phosphatase PAP2 family protein [Solirubrobacteraceae bacterium]
MVERFSKLGEHGAIWVAIGLAGAAVDKSRREEWLRGLRRVGLAYGVNQLIKVVVRRQRPAGRLAATHSNLSFPSAHATTSFCAARMYARLGLPLYPLALALAASRLILKVHHPSDVVAGAALGTVIAR